MLPPPDPYEQPFAEPDGATSIIAPTTMLPRGCRSRDVERFADAIIKARPGLLIVVCRTA